MPTSSADTFASECAAYCAKHGNKPEVVQTMVTHIKTNVKDARMQQLVLDKFAAILKAAQAPEARVDRKKRGVGEGDKADQADDQLDEEEEEDEDDEEDDEEDEESGDEVDVEGDEDVFDLDQFKSGKTFDQEAAEQAFTAWKRERDSRRVPLSFYSGANASPEVPDIPDDVFNRNRNAMTQKLIGRDVAKLKEMEAALADPELTSRERKKITQKRDVLARIVRDRQAQVS